MRLTAPPRDVVAYAEQRVADARAEAARAVDRAEAWVAFRSKAIELARREDRMTITAEALWSACRDERERAELQAIVDRAMPLGSEDDYYQP